MIIRGYHVYESTPGYMPDDTPDHFNSRRAAEQSALWLARELRSAGYKVSGNMRDGYYGQRDAHDLGRIITIAPCMEAECQVVAGAISGGPRKLGMRTPIACVPWLRA